MHLNPSHCNLLLVLLLKFEELFDGTLRDWKLPPVSFELKEGAKPYHGRPYPITKIHKATLMKEIDRLILMRVLKWQPSSKWALPSFIIPKKDHTVCTISDFRELNKRIVRKPYPIPKISTTLQELEGFTYATTLDLNMGYYTIRLDLTATKLDITKGSLDDHLDKLKQFFIRLGDAGLKINATKSVFCAQETEYLGYILTRGGIQPQPKKVQSILALNLANNVKELR
jgi:hypothetical protein